MVNIYNNTLQIYHTGAHLQSSSITCLVEEGPTPKGLGPWSYPQVCPVFFAHLNKLFSTSPGSDTGKFTQTGHKHKHKNSNR